MSVARATAWPPLSTDRLADALTTLAERASTQEHRAQLHGLAGILRNLGGEETGAEERAGLEAELEAAIAREDEGRAVTAMRALARLDRSVVHHVDWDRASSG